MTICLLSLLFIFNYRARKDYNPKTHGQAFTINPHEFNQLALLSQTYS